MTKKKQPFGMPPRGEPGDLPGHLRGEKTGPRVLQNATPDDYVWLGDEGEFDTDAFLSDLLPPLQLLQTVLLTIIDAHPVPDRSREERLSAATKALTGTLPPRGRRTSTDYDHALAWMAREFFLGFYGFQLPDSSLDALAHRALKQDEAYRKLDPEVQHSRRKVLRGKFNREKDGLLARWNCNDTTIRETNTKVAEAVAALKALGSEAKNPTLQENKPDDAELSPSPAGDRSRPR